MKRKSESDFEESLKALREAHLSPGQIDNVLTAGACLGAMMGIGLGLSLSHFFGFWIWLWVPLATVGGIVGLIGSAVLIADEAY